jgi:ribosomal protein L11 methyltransferase
VSKIENIWRIAFVADGATQVPFAQAIEDIVDSVSSMESAPGGPWRVEGLRQGEPDRTDVAARLKRTAQEIGVPAPELVIERLPDIDWLAENRKSFPPLRVGRFYVYGSHIKDAPPQGTHAIALDAGIAFGSGEHATTKGCLIAIERLARRQRRARVLDVGTGSGILAIAAARAWPARVLASDIDKDSVHVAAENMTRNAVAARVRVRHADGLAKLPRHKGRDLVLANILAKPLCRLSRAIARAVKPGGVVVLSGLLAEQETQVRAAYRAHRLVFQGRIPINGWHTLILRRGR